MTLRVPLQTGKEGTVGLPETTKRREKQKKKSNAGNGEVVLRERERSMKVRMIMCVLDICIFLHCLKDWIFNGC